MYPISLSEKLMYSTVRLTATNGSTGTGFFFNFTVNDKIVPVIVTNKHVINYNPTETITFRLHTGSYSDRSVDDESLPLTFNTEWIFHNSLDLCFCYINPLLEQCIIKTNKHPFFIHLTPDMILDDNKLKALSAIEDVTMVGYPNGLWNEATNLPLFRRGITASHPGFDFNDTNIGVVDMACFPGSSGSPIFILNENGYTDKTGTHLGNSRLIFLGILFSGPTMSIDGTLIEKTIETKQNIIPRSFNMINLGYYIKAHELFSFINIIEKDLKN